MRSRKNCMLCLVIPATDPEYVWPQIWEHTPGQKTRTGVGDPPVRSDMRCIALRHVTHGPRCKLQSQTCTTSPSNQTPDNQNLMGCTAASHEWSAQQPAFINMRCRPQECESGEQTHETELQHALNGLRCKPNSTCPASYTKPNKKNNS